MSLLCSKLSSHAHETVTKIDHILGHKTNFKKFKRTDIVHSIFFCYNRIKLDRNQQQTTGKSPTFRNQTTYL